MSMEIAFINGSIHLADETGIPNVQRDARLAHFSKALRAAVG